MRKTHLGGAIVAALVLVMLPGCGRAERMDATPSTIRARLSAAGSGDTIKLGRGEYRDLFIQGRRFSPPLTIDATDATLVEARISKSQGLIIRGGAIQLGPPRVNPKNGKDAFGSGIRMNDVEDVKIVGTRFVGPGAGKPGVKDKAC